MTTRLMLIALATLFVTGPAAAQQFYVVQDTTSKKCTVVSQKPTGTTTVLVGVDHAYASQSAAEKAIGTINACGGAIGGPGQ